ncbi:MAG: tetratricopeptide repeat protein, partial [Pseudomonadota bacterium]|nr:tetratricopeptide repeat protein [Pseudomonadota bacterium]
MAKRPQSSLSAREQKILIQAGLAYEAGDIYQAESLAGQILQRHPHQFDASYILAIVAVERENPKARQLALNLVPFLPQTAEHQFNMGVLFEKLRDFDSAATYYRCSLQLRSDHFETLMALGNCELALRHPDTAIELFETCRQLQPCDPRVWNNLGAAFNETSCLDKAEKAYLEGQRLDPTSSFIQTGLACVYGRMNRLDCAIPLLEEVIANNPGYETAHFNYSAFLLISGQFKKGWPEYEWRRKTPVWKEDMPAMSQPEWQGEALLNKTLLIVCEQGIGDTIQFIRFLPKLLAMGATVAIACEPILTPLLACLNLPVQLIDKKTQASNFKADFWLPLLSLALRLDIDLLNPDSSPYIRISDEKIRDASQKIHKHAPNATRKIGLIWAGNPRHSNDLNRSMHPGQFLPLANLKETVFFSLQKNGPGPQAYPELKNLNIIDLAPYLETLL